MIAYNDHNNLVELGGKTISMYTNCITPANVATKVVSIENLSSLKIGTTIRVRFDYSNATENPKLNVNGLGAIPIYSHGTTVGNTWQAGSVVQLTYDGNCWLIGGGAGSGGGLPEDPLSVTHGGTGNTDGYVRAGQKSGTTIGNYATAEGNSTTASGEASHAAGTGTVAGYANQTVVGKYNSNNSATLFEVGNGSSTSSRSNAFEVRSNGNANVSGSLSVNGTVSGSTISGSTVRNSSGTLNVVTANPTGTASGSLTKLQVGSTIYSVDGGGGGGMPGDPLPIGHGGTGNTEGYIQTGLKSGVTDIGSKCTIEGYYNSAFGSYDHLEGQQNESNYNGGSNHMEGRNSKIVRGANSHTEGGYHTIGGSSNDYPGWYCHAEGYSCTAYGRSSDIDPGQNGCAHAEGHTTKALRYGAHSEGVSTTASAIGSHAEGYNTTAASSSTTNAHGAHAEGSGSSASGEGAHAEGYQSTASGQGAHAEGNSTASGDYTHSEGDSTASKACAHAEGDHTTASGEYGSHAEGSGSVASNDAAHAEGYSTKASGTYGSHAEGNGSEAQGRSSHAEGRYTTASGDFSHSSGESTTAQGKWSFAGGHYAKALYDNNFVFAFGTSSTNCVQSDKKGQFILGDLSAKKFPSAADTNLIADGTGFSVMASCLECANSNYDCYNGFSGTLEGSTTGISLVNFCPGGFYLITVANYKASGQYETGELISCGVYMLFSMIKVSGKLLTLSSDGDMAGVVYSSGQLSITRIADTSSLKTATQVSVIRIN